MLEFPELTSSTRRDHWLALTKEIMLMHQFLSRYKVECQIQAWEMHARTILGIIRLHAAREMLRISPPDPKNFFIFALYDELPKGDYVLNELADSLKKVNSAHPCSGSSILRSMNLSIISTVKVEEDLTSVGDDSLSTLKTVINQVKEEATETQIAKSTTEVLKEDGFSENFLVFMVSFIKFPCYALCFSFAISCPGGYPFLSIMQELLKPVKSVLPWFQETLSWERPVTTLTLIAATVLIVYR